MTLLEVDGLTKSFGGLVAVDNASFDLEAEEILGLAGPNGAGKTVTFNCITGQHRPDAGRVTFRGNDITDLPPDAVARAGIGRTFQEVRVYPRFTVRENLVFAAQEKGLAQSAASAVGASGSGSADRRLVARADELLEAVELDGHANEPAEALSYGQRKILSFAAALVTHPEPDLILLDEPMAGVNPTMINTLADHIRTFNDRGRSFLIVEHNVRLMSELCDRLVVMSAGRPIADGPPDEVRQKEEVVEAYFGE